MLVIYWPGKLCSVNEQNNLENLGEERRETVPESLNLVLLSAHVSELQDQFCLFPVNSCEGVFCLN